MRRLSLLVVTLAFALTSVYAADVKLDGVKCIVAAKNPAKADKTRDYKDGKVYFCCDNCPKEFDKDKAKYATKANAQLVATGQAKQAKCPISGQAVDTTKELTVGGAKVQFCCDMCKGKVEKAKDDEKLELVFSDKAFEKAGFKVEKK
jgi:YHS domain-containing protein